MGIAILMRYRSPKILLPPFSRPIFGAAFFISKKVIDIKKLLKWFGSKAKLLDTLTRKMPKTYNAFYEPFVGSGAFIFNQEPRNGYINDLNTALVNVYRQLKNDPDNLIDKLLDMDSIACNSDRYYELRRKYNQKLKANNYDAETAALLLYLNKHCFSGLYRVNKKGEFNAAWNHRIKPDPLDTENLMAIGKYLSDNDITIENEDFERFADKAQPRDFVYFDSPYVPETKTANFVGYTSAGFSLEDQKRLAELFQRLTERKVFCMLSNSDTEITRSLYADFHIDKVYVSRSIGGTKNKNIGYEIIVTNY